LHSNAAAAARSVARSSGSSCVAVDSNDGQLGCRAWAWHAWDAANGMAAGGKLRDG